jgi:hypothetical protein
MDKEIWTGRIVKQSSKNRNERRTGQIKDIRKRIVGNEDSLSRKDQGIGCVRDVNRKSEQALWDGFKKISDRNSKNSAYGTRTQY